MFAALRRRRLTPTRLARRVALFAMLAVEFAVVLGPIVEPHHEATAAHVEQTGTTHHHLVHNEETCAVCALRSLRTLPSHGDVVIAAVAPAGFLLAAAFSPAAARGGAVNSSRAPPVAG